MAKGTKSEKKTVVDAKTKVSKKEAKVAGPVKAPRASKDIVEDKKPVAKATKASASNGKSKKAAKAESSDESSESSSEEEEKPKAVQVKAALKAATSSSDSESGSDSSEDEKPVTKPAAKPAPATPSSKKVAPKKAPSPSSSSSESDSDSETEEEKQPATTLKKAAAAKAASSSSDDSGSDSDSDTEDEKPAQKAKAAAPAVKTPAKATPSKVAPKKADSSDDSDSDSSDSESDDEKPAATTTSKDSSSSESSSGEDSDVEMAAPTKPAPATNGKRKGAGDDTPAPKKAKLANGDAAPASGAAESTTIFVGRLSWSVDNDRLEQEFAQYGEIESAVVQFDRDSGKSRGFGHVRFKTPASAQKALEMNGKEIDGRPVNVDITQPIDKSQRQERRAKTFGDQPSEPSGTLFVGNLSFGVSEDTVWNYFNEYGVKNVRLPTDRETGRPKGFGYVEFEDVDGAKRAFEAMNGADLEGRPIRLDYSQPRDNSGGGRGGFGGDRGGRGGFGGRGGGRGGFGDRGGRGGGGFGGRGRGGGDRGRGGGDRGRGGGRGRGAPRGGSVRTGGIASFEGKKTTF